MIIQNIINFILYILSEMDDNIGGIGQVDEQMSLGYIDGRIG
jgi:hypothetical protein